MHPFIKMLQYGDVEVRGSYTFYKNYNVEEAKDYYEHCAYKHSEFKDYLNKQKDKLDFFTLLKDITDVEQATIYFYEREILNTSLLTVKKSRKLSKEAAHAIIDRDIRWLEQMVMYELGLINEVKKSIVQAHPKSKFAKTKVEEIVAPTEKVVAIDKIDFNGEAQTLVALFELFYTSRYFVFTNYDHFEKFIKENFTANGEPIPNVMKPLAVVRQRYSVPEKTQKAHDRRRAKVNLMLNTVIKPLVKMKEEIDQNPLYIPPEP